MKIFIFLLMLLTQTAGLAQTSLKLAVIADSSVSEVGSKILIESNYSASKQGASTFPENA
jgi:hypothetical protein